MSDLLSDSTDFCRPGTEFVVRHATRWSVAHLNLEQDYANGSEQPFAGLGTVGTDPSSHAVRRIVRIHVGHALIMSRAMDVRTPPARSIHFFDDPLCRRSDREEPFEGWVKKRELLSL